MTLQIFCDRFLPLGLTILELNVSQKDLEDVLDAKIAAPDDFIWLFPSQRDTVETHPLVVETITTAWKHLTACQWSLMPYEDVHCDFLGRPALCVGVHSHVIQLFFFLWRSAIVRQLLDALLPGRSRDLLVHISIHKKKYIFMFPVIIRLLCPSLLLRDFIFVCAL